MNNSRGKNAVHSTKLEQLLILSPDSLFPDKISIWEVFTPCLNFSTVIHQ